MDEFINSEKNLLGISDFLQSAEAYTKNNFPNLDMDNLFTSAINGNISNNFWTSTILNLARQGNKINIATYDNCINRNYYT